MTEYRKMHNLNVDAMLMEVMHGLRLYCYVREEAEHAYDENV